MNWTLSGYKMYLAAALLAAVALSEGFFGLDVPGVQLEANWIEALIGALGLGGLKAALSKVGK